MDFHAAVSLVIVGPSAFISTQFTLLLPLHIQSRYAIVRSDHAAMFDVICMVQVRHRESIRLASARIRLADAAKIIFCNE